MEGKGSCDMIDAELLVDQESRSYRMSHVDLNTPCIINDTLYNNRAPSHVYRKALAEFTNTNLPTGNDYHACHACNDGRCVNAEHLYWGTPKENEDDLLTYLSSLQTSGKIITKRDVFMRIRMQDYDQRVASGHIQEMHEITNPIPARDTANIGDTILVAVPEGKSSYHSHYVMRRNPHPRATPKNNRWSLLLKPHEKDAFHMACIHAICLFFENHPHKQRGWVPTELAEQWLYAWDRGEVNTKEDLFSLYENWRPNNLVFFG